MKMSRVARRMITLTDTLVDSKFRVFGDFLNKPKYIDIDSTELKKNDLPIT